jgi:Mg2+-importing ATPase
VRASSPIRSPLDVAILAGAPADEQAAFTKLDEIPFDFERRRLSVVVERNEERLLITKGAPDALCARCSDNVPDPCRQVVTP